MLHCLNHTARGKSHYGFLHCLRFCKNHAEGFFLPRIDPDAGGGEHARPVHPPANRLRRLSTQKSVFFETAPGLLFETLTQWAIADQHQLDLRKFFLHFRHRLNQVAGAFSLGEPSNEEDDRFGFNARGRKESGIHSDVMNDELLGRNILFQQLPTDKIRDRQKQRSPAPQRVSVSQIATVSECGLAAPWIERGGIRSVKGHDERQAKLPRQGQSPQAVGAEMGMNQNRIESMQPPNQIRSLSK